MTKSKETTPAHKVAAALHSTTLSYQDLHAISFVLHQNSSPGDYKRWIEFEHIRIKGD